MHLVQFIIQTNKCTKYTHARTHTHTHTRISTIFYVPLVLQHVSMHLHHLQGVLFFYFAEVTKSIKIIKLRKTSRLKCL